MKKSLVLAICLLTAVSLFADGFLDSFRDSRNYIPDEILLLTGNDKFNYGISRNDDDQLSYSFDFKVESPLWYLQFDANGFTDRGYREGWDMRKQDQYCTPGSHVVRGRYDSLETVLGLKLRLVENDFYIHVYPDIGFALVGDYGWEWGQNAVHRLLGVHIVDLPYEKGGVKTVRLMLDGRVNIGYKLLKLKRTNLIAEIEASSRNMMGFHSENQILGRISISTETHDIIGFHFGYMFANGSEDDSWYTQDLYYRYLRGWRVGFTIDSGILVLNYTGTPETGFGYGYFGIDVLGFFEPKTWEATDAYLSFSKARFYGSFYNYITLGLPFGEKKFAFVVKNAYLGGNPVDKKDEITADLNKVDRYKREYSSFAIGIRFNLPDFASGFITPYIELTGGLQVYHIYELHNQLDDETMEKFVMLPQSYIFEFGHFFPMLSLEGGISVLPDGFLAFQDTSMQFEIFGGVNFLMGGETYDISLYRYIHRAWAEKDYLVGDMGLRARFIPYFGFGLKLGFDF